MAEKQDELHFDILFKFENNLNNNRNTYEQFGKLYNILICNKNKIIGIDFSKVSFIAANLFAVLGACLDNTAKKNNNSIYFIQINASIKSLMARNRFGRCFDMKLQNDKYKSCIEYRVFRAVTEQVEEFEKYLLLQIFNHKCFLQDLFV